MMRRSLTGDSTASILKPLIEANRGFMAQFPGESDDRQPVHTVYGGAHLFRADSARKLGELALRSLTAFAPEHVTFARAIGLAGAADLASDVERAAAGTPGWLARTIYQRVIEKLEREPVEDFRVDFEDGYGNRPDDEEDACAVNAAEEVARGMSDGTLPPFLGIRIKPFSAELHRRSVRTLDIFLSALADRTGGRLPDHFVVTLPKVVRAEQVTALVDLFEKIERDTPIQPASLKLEIMVETPQSIIAADGTCALPSLVRAGRGRCISAHFGVYDYTASCTVTAEHQTMAHPACDYARHAMQVSLAGTGVWLSDGATNIMPVAPHRGDRLAPDQVRTNELTVHRAWRLHYDDVRRSLYHAYFQGWDLHPAQLPTRYAALYAFFLEGLDAASMRLKTFVEQAAQATLVGDIFDDAATGQGLLNFFLRGLNCGAITEAEAEATGLTIEELRSRSFVKILEGRRRR